MKLDYFLIPHTKINSKCIKNINVKFETIKSLEENLGSMLFDIYLSNTLLDLSPQVRATKAKIKKWDCNKLKSFAQQRKPSAK